MTIDEAVRDWMQRDTEALERECRALLNAGYRPEDCMILETPVGPDFSAYERHAIPTVILPLVQREMLAAFSERRDLDMAYLIWRLIKETRPADVTPLSASNFHSVR